MKYKLIMWWIDIRSWVIIHLWIPFTGMMMKALIIASFLLTGMVLGIVKPHKFVPFCHRLRLETERAAEEMAEYSRQAKARRSASFDLCTGELEELQSTITSALTSDNFNRVEVEGLFEQMHEAVDKLKENEEDEAMREPEQSFLLMLKDAWVHAWNL